MKYKKSLVWWYLKQIDLIYYKLIKNKKLTKRQQNIYYILEEYDFYVPKKWKCYDEKNNIRR